MSFLKIFLTEATEAATEAAAQQGGALDGMVDMLDTLMLIMLFGFGIYGLYSAIRLRKEHLLFGAFVDIGVHQDGLVHISRMANRFIKHPAEVVKVGDVIKVWVVEVDPKKKRIALTMLPPKA